MCRSQTEDGKYPGHIPEKADERGQKRETGIQMILILLQILGEFLLSIFWIRTPSTGVPKYKNPPPPPKAVIKGSDLLLKMKLENEPR